MIPSTSLLRLGFAAWMAAAAAAYSVQTTSRSTLRSLGQKSVVGSASASQRPNAASLKMEGELCFAVTDRKVEAREQAWTGVDMDLGPNKYLVSYSSLLLLL